MKDCTYCEKVISLHSVEGLVCHAMNELRQASLQIHIYWAGGHFLSPRYTWRVLDVADWRMVCGKCDGSGHGMG